MGSVAEMNDPTEKTSSCLPITEKKTQRPGGCIGIFFQLFDWNRRLAKKKLFSKKLLPPARAKQASKKFKGDEKMPNSKLHLIANENSGGFPSSKKYGNRGLDVERKHEMRVPGLVARLMGLESIPAAQRGKFKKASFSDPCVNGEKESLGTLCESDSEEGVNSEMGVAKKDSRPQKLQKTGSYERKAVTRFGAETFQIKSVLSRARKHHYHHNHPKLVSPLKSPGIASGKNVSRSSKLIGAATKILEPGLQATSRAKNGITYSHSMYLPKNEVVNEGLGTSSADLQNNSGYESSTAMPLMGQTSCKSCGNLLDVENCRPNVDRQPAVLYPVNSDVITASSMVSPQGKARPFMVSHEQERDVVLLKSQDQLISLIDEEVGKSNNQCLDEPTTKIMPLPRECLAPWNSSRQLCGTLEDDTYLVGFNPNTQTQEHIVGIDRVSPGSRVCNQQVKRVSSTANTVGVTKDFVALNRTLSSQTRIRSPSKVDSSKFNLERKPCIRQDDSSSRARTLERKRRTPNVTQAETTASLHSTTATQRNIRSDVQGGKRGLNACSVNITNVKNRRGGQGKMEKIIDNKVNNVVSFAFNSPLNPKAGVPTETEDKSTDREMKTYFQKPSPLRGDALGAFLEQKLKELTSQEDEELATGAPPKRSAAKILQELISALSAEHLTCHDGQMVNFDISYHDVVGKERFRGACDCNHLSPGCVLDASFSSSSLDESSVHGFHPGSMNCHYNQLHQLEPDSELLDSATSSNKWKIGIESMADLVDKICRILQSASFSGVRLTRSKLNHVKDVILDSELLLGNATMHKDGVPHLFLVRFLFDELDTLTDDAMCLDLVGTVDLEDSKERCQLKGFLFDFVIEYLESNCCRYCNCGFRAWTKLPLCMKADMLIQEVKREINKWVCIAGMNFDDIIELEMSYSSLGKWGKWTEFDVEAFESGIEIGGDILQVLLDEVLLDLVDCKQDYI
ncbi:hypothetical protein L6164_007755 [Bauhinia variegata]|uniref:Uncharacterized protein n=1 Tax=Bauhinia variegata TaxID=167791 RepID=A0ACB9PFR7_BAUVA|nr:hypothetical protein L6164_007755 [Bauhinia variegata]